MQPPLHVRAAESGPWESEGREKLFGGPNRIPAYPPNLVLGTCPFCTSKFIKWTSLLKPKTFIT